jgi:hypothetical protein
MALEKDEGQIIPRWFDRYHDRLRIAENTVGVLEIEVTRWKRNLRAMKIKFERQGVRIFGNGKPGFVREEIEKAMDKVEDNLTLKMKVAITEALDERDKQLGVKELRKEEKVSSRLWDIAKFILGFAQAVIMAYIGWKFLP